MVEKNLKMEKISKGIVAQIVILLLGMLVILGFFSFRLYQEFKSGRNLFTTFKNNSQLPISPIPATNYLNNTAISTNQKENLQKINTDLEDLKNNLSELDKQTGNEEN